MFTTIQDDLNPVEILTNVLQYLTSNYGGSMAAHIVSIALRQVKEIRPDGETADTLALEASPSVGGGSSPSQGTKCSCTIRSYLYRTNGNVRCIKCGLIVCSISQSGETADAADSKPAPIRDEGSTPSSGTK